MYCPRCLNDTLKLASSGVVKVTFNGKAKATSRFFYDLSRERQSEINKKFESVIDEYFCWYATFQNKEPLTRLEIFSSDFICVNRCFLGPNTQFSALDLVVPKKIALETIERMAQRHDVPLGKRFL